jgi:hypothetical protein
VFHLGRLLPHLQTINYPRKACEEGTLKFIMKVRSLRQKFVTYGRKKFYNIGPSSHSPAKITNSSYGRKMVYSIGDYFISSWGYAGVMLGLCWGYAGICWEYAGGMLVVCWGYAGCHAGKDVVW